MSDVPPDKEEGTAIDQSAFETIERDFQDVLKELAGDRSLEKFRGEYEKLHMALRKSYENEKRLIKRVKELGTEIKINSFVRFEKGQGLEKKEDNFADEVAGMIK